MWSGCLESAVSSDLLPVDFFSLQNFAAVSLGVKLTLLATDVAQ